MSLSKYRIKLRKNKGVIAEGLPQYSLTYKNDPVSAGRISHEILSAFIGSDDVIIEINSDMSGPDRRQIDPAALLIEKAEELGLASRKKKVLSEKGNAVLGFLVRSKKQATEALIHIPNDVWNHPDLKSCLPLYGARYYITKGASDAPSMLDKMPEMSEEEKAEAFRMIVFDLAVYGQMGILSASISMEDIKRMLGP